MPSNAEPFSVDPAKPKESIVSLTVSTELVYATESEALKGYRGDAEHMRGDRDMEIDTTRLEETGLKDIIRAAGVIGDTKTARAAESILLARTGRFDKPVPNFKAFKGVLDAFLKSDLMDGWIYVTGADGKLYPQLVTGVSESPRVSWRPVGLSQTDMTA